MDEPEKYICRSVVIGIQFLKSLFHELRKGFNFHPFTRNITNWNYGLPARRPVLENFYQIFKMSLKNLSLSRSGEKIVLYEKQGN